MIADIELADLKLNKEESKILHNKLVSKIDKLLPSFDEDVKKALIKIQKSTRFGFKASFEMWLPKNKHIFAESKHKELLGAISDLDDKVSTQIRNYKEKLVSHK